MKIGSKNHIESRGIFSSHFFALWLIVWLCSITFALMGVNHTINHSNQKNQDALQEMLFPQIRHNLERHAPTQVRLFFDKLIKAGVVTYFAVTIHYPDSTLVIAHESDVPEQDRLKHFFVRFKHDNELINALVTFSFPAESLKKFLTENIKIIVLFVLIIGIFWFLILFRLVQLSLITPISQMSAVTERLVKEDVLVPRFKFSKRFFPFFHEDSRKLFEHMNHLAKKLRFYRSKEQAARRQLAETEENFRLLTETARDIILVHDMDGNILFINEAGLKFCGYNREQMQQKRVRDFIPAEYADVISEKKANRLRGDVQKYLFEVEIFNRHGERVPVEISSSPIIRNGKIEAIFVVARDITARKKTERILDEYKNHLQELVKKRTSELEEKNRELERLNDLFVGREFRIKELKEKVKILSQRLQYLESKIKDSR